MLTMTQVKIINEFNDDISKIADGHTSDDVLERLKNI